MLQILIVDDEENLRKAVAKYAKFQGYSVEEASNGEEAVQLCRSKRFDLILLDLMMPGMDGIAACRAIRKFSDTPIIMLTAKNEEYDRIIGFESGADDYVAKPFSPKELMLRINAVLKRTRRAKADFGEDGGNLSIRYALEVDSQPIGENAFEIRVTEPQLVPPAPGQ